MHALTRWAVLQKCPLKCLTKGHLGYYNLCTCSLHIDPCGIQKKKHGLFPEPEQGEMQLWQKDLWNSMLE